MSAPVDVLAVMRADYVDASVQRMWDDDAPQRAADSEEAQVAVAELIEALDTLLSVYAKPDQGMCCDGRECGCMGASVYQEAEHYARAALARVRPMTREQQAEQAGVRG
ncbi:hypothetical protein [Lysobacter sp. F6437]|uniref:hypothetical protein n=1 Tax=Lysobacter sp. F6437 TaxID=3459296 RepID=UPI00403DA785